MLYRKTILYLMGMLLYMGTNAQQPVGRYPSLPFDLTWKNKPEKFQITDTDVVIEAGQKTDMFRDPNIAYNTCNAPILFFNPDDDFVLRARIEHPFKSKWDGGAIVI